MKLIHKLFILFFGLCVSVAGYAQSFYCSKISNETIIQKEYLTISYNTNYNIPNYVGECLTIDMLDGNISRLSRFYAEPDYTKITHNFYGRSGYDRGHMAPAADFKGCPDGMYESFSICNVAPQLPKFNRIYWEQLEEYIRKIAKQCDKTYVITGTVSKYSMYCFNGIMVPTHFYKAIVGIKDNKKVVSCAWLYKHNELKQTVEETKMSIDELEAFINVNLFYELNKHDKYTESKIKFENSK